MTAYFMTTYPQLVHFVRHFGSRELQRLTATVVTSKRGSSFLWWVLVTPHEYVDYIVDGGAE